MSRQSNPLVSIAFATMNRREFVEIVLNDLRLELKGIAYEVVIVDGNSKDGTKEYLQAQNDVVLVDEGRPEGCRRAFDLALRGCRGEFVCWLNDDVRVSPGALTAMLDFLRAPENANVGLGAFPASASADQLERFVFNCYAFPPVPFADMGMLRRDLLKKIGYLDSRFRRFGWDPDLSMKVWDLGLNVRVLPGAHIVHYFYNDSNRSSNEHLRYEDADLLGAKWGDKLDTLAKRAWTPELLKAAEPYLLPLNKAQIYLYLKQRTKLTKVLQNAPDLPALLSSIYHIGLGEHRKNNFPTARLAYQAVCAFGEHNPEIAAWAHFKLGELLQGWGRPIKAKPDPKPEAKKNWQKALEYKPDLDKAKIHATPANTPLRVGFGLDRDTPADCIGLQAKPGDDFAWEYLFERRGPDVLYLGRAVLNDQVDDALSNALRHTDEDAEILSASAKGWLKVRAGDLRARTRDYAGEFTRWRDALKCGWLVAKAPPGPGERDIEWPWVLERAARLGPGRLLDVGSYHTPLPKKLAELGFQVLALDINPVGGDPHANVRPVQGDIRGCGLPAGSFDAVSCVSTIEHIGVPGRYGIEDCDALGDAKAMREMARLLVPGGTLWLTVPMGCRDVPPINRCYDLARLERLFAEYTLVSSRFMLREAEGTWSECDGQAASTTDWYAAPWYSLGLFELRKRGA